MASVIQQLPPVELFHACDATEALSLLENVKPDVIVLDNDLTEERDMFMESIGGDHPPILIQVSEDGEGRSSGSEGVLYVTKTATLEGLHKMLLVATTVATQGHLPKAPPHVH